MAGEVSKAELDALEAGIDALLNRIQSLLELKAYAENLPIIGSQLAQAQAALETITELRDTIRDAIDAVSNLPGLATMAAAAVRDELQSEINDALSALTGSGFSGLVTVTVDESTGDLALVFDTGRTTSATFAAGDLGMSGLGLDMSGNATAQLAYDFNFKVGLDSTGFYLDTAASNLTLGADVSLNGLSASTSLGFLNFTASNISDSDPAAGADTLTLDLATSWNQGGLVRDFSGDLLNVTASGDLDLDIHLAADMGNAALPEISADLHVDWGFNQNLLNGTAANSWNAATVTFDNVEYDFGSFVEDFITPLLEQLDPILGPINDALAVLRTDISGILLPEWVELLDVVDDDRITALDFLQLASNTAGLGLDFAPLAQLIDVVDTIVDVVEFFRGRDFADAGFEVGDYQFQLQQIQGAADTLAQLDIGSGTFTDANVDLGTFIGGLSALAGFAATHDGSTGGELVDDLLDNPLLSFAPAENPLSIIQLLLGQDIDLFNFDLPTINLPLGMDAAGNITSPITAFTLPIWPLPLVTANLNVAAQVVIDLAFGYDTSGLSQYAAGGFSNPALVLNGFYLDDQRSGDTDTPEVVIRAAIELALDANFAIVSAGGGGNLIGEVALDFADSLFGADARLYANELPSDLLSNPFQIFDVSGRVTAGLRFYVNSVVGNLINWNSQRITLAEFSFVQGAESAGPPPGLADQFGGDLWVNIGDRADERDIANTSDGSEYFELGAGPDGKVVVNAFGATQVFGEGDAVGAIELDAGAGNDEVVMDAAVTVAARMTGGAGYDALTAGGGADHLYGGSEDDWLRGNAGADELYGEDGNDYLEGGADGDRVDGGAGDYDIATYVGSEAGVTLNLATGVHLGDAGGDTFFGVEIFEGSRHADVMTGGGGTDVFASIEGDDTLNGAGGDDILAAGTGANQLDGGDGYDIANYYFASSGISASIANFGGTVVAGPEGAPTIDDTLSGIEQLDGSDFADAMTGGAGRQVFVGAGGDDALDGGDDDDVLVGGTGADALTGGDGVDFASYVTAGEGVTANLASGGTGGEAIGDSYATIENLIGSDFGDGLTGDADANYIYGGLGNDALNGAGGDDTLEGGSGADAFTGGGGTDAVTYAASASAIVLDRRTPGNSTGDAMGDSFSAVEVISGTDFNDTIRGSDSTSEPETLQGGDGNDGLYGGLGGDTLIGEAGADTLAGEEGADTLQGSDGIDSLAGGSGDDTLHGGAGNDAIDGGADRDRVTYFDSFTSVRVNLGTSQLTLGGVAVAGLSAHDGFAGTDTFAAGAGGLSSVEDATGSVLADYLAASEAGSRLDGLGGNDVLIGQAGDDWLTGGTGVDDLAGGDGSDVLEGGSGVDVLNGQGGLLDIASYENDAAGVVASLAGGSATDGSGASDVLSNFEGLRGSAHGDVLTGDGAANRIEGLGGVDTIDGGAEADTMLGGAGDDIYYVDRVTLQTGNDVVIEASGEGSDLIRSSVDYGTLDFVVPLAAEVEDLQLLGSAAFGYGNSANNRLIGNAAANTFDGRQGADQFWGYGGNDTYYFDGWGDQLGVGDAPRSGLSGDGEQAGGGTDTVLLTTTSLANPGEGATYSIDVAWGQQLENVFLTDHDRAIGLTGNARDNHLVGNNHWQTLSGADGNDRLDPGSGGGKDVVHGGAGSDTLELDWSNVTDYEFANGTFSGTLAGGYSGHYQAGIDYNDFRQRNRVDFTGIEHFHIKLGAWSDTIQTGDGNDSVWGGAGDDRLTTGRGADAVDGEAGNDRWFADKSAATAAIYLDLNAAAGSTYEIGGLGGSMRGIEALGWDGSNRFQTGSGNDHVMTRTEYHWDFIATNAGHDTVVVAGGKDMVDLGAGTDTLIVDWSDVTDYWFDFAELTGDLAGGYSGRFHQGLDYNDHRTPDRVDFAGVEHFQLHFGANSDQMHTGDGDDILDGGGGNDFMSTRKGVDNVDGGAGTDRWLADKSDATVGMAIDLTAAGGWTYQVGGITATVNRVEVLGQNASNLFQTGSGGDSVTTINAYEWDFIATNGGDDTVRVYGGKDVVAMGAGNDTLVVDWSDVTDYWFDWAELTGDLTNGYSGNFRQGLDYNDHRIPDRVDFSGVEHFHLSFGANGDTLWTGDGNDVLRAGAGNDFLSSGGGIDDVDGQDGTDRWLADKSAATAGMTLDLSSTEASTYAIAGGTGSMRGIEALGASASQLFKSGSGNDTIVTFNAYYRDWVSTGAGDDTVTLTGGKDTVDLGAGNDTLVVDWSDVTSYYFNFAELSGSLATGYSGRFHQDLDYDDHRTPDRVDFAGVEHFVMSFGSGHDHMHTGDGNDTLSGGAGNDYIASRQGLDTIDGGDGTDRWLADKSAATVGMTLDLAASGPSTYQLGGQSASVQGIEVLGLNADNRFQSGAGNDVIVTRTEYEWDFIATNAGDDRVTVAGGKDVVDMGAGTDTLVVDWSDVTDYVFDFAELTGDLAGGYSGTFRQGIDYNDHRRPDRIDFSGVEHFVLSFGAGNDTLRTGSGNDVLNGGAGDDYLNSGQGLDDVDGGAGNDRWMADKSAATTAIVLDLTSAATFAYGIGNGSATVTGIETLGADGGNLFATGSGDDVIVTRRDGNWDFISTGAGNDRVTVAGGKDVVDLGAGTDTLVIDWSASGWVLDFNASELTGSLAAGYSGRYQNYLDYGDYRQPERVHFQGVEHFDVTLGNNGNFVTTGDGNDRIRGGTGGDLMRAAGGTDTLDYSGRTVSVALTLNGTTDAAVLLNGAHEDTVSGFENVLGGSGNDALTGDGGVNVLTGNAGDDALDGGGGDDLLNGGAGADVLNGGAGFDTVDLTDLAGEIALQFNGDGSVTILADGVAGDTLRNVERALLASGATILLGDAGGNVLTAGSGADLLVGGDGNDYLVGGGGDDTMAGGKGDDTFYVDDAGDLPLELAGEGSDRVSSSISYFLAADAPIELIELGDRASTLALNLGGSDFANTLMGNAGANFLYGNGEGDTLWGFGGDDYLVGGTGADVMYGGAGNDTYYIDVVGDLIYELAGEGFDRVAPSIDYTLPDNAEVELVEAVNLLDTTPLRLGGSSFANTIYGNNGGNFLYGYAGNDWLWGFGGDDYLVGGTGNDVMYGGLGNDVYYVDSTGDLVYELAGEGYDRVAAEITLSLPDNAEIELLEAVNLTATERMDLGGSDLANTITGNDGMNVIHGHGGNDVLYGRSGDDYLSGGAGNDTMTGGTGNDTYYVDAAGDAIVELAGEGTDRVVASASYTLAASASVELVETADDAGTAALALTGSAVANTVRGNAGANTLNGRGGSDVLWGLGGADTFAFNTNLSAGNVDAIADFAPGIDKLSLDDLVFAALTPGALPAGALRIGTAAADADDRIVYDSATGALYYDADGSGAGTAVQFAALAAGLGLTAGDFVVI